MILVANNKVVICLVLCSVFLSACGCSSDDILFSQIPNTTSKLSASGYRSSNDFAGFYEAQVNDIITIDLSLSTQLDNRCSPPDQATVYQAIGFCFEIDGKVYGYCTKDEEQGIPDLPDSIQVIDNTPLAYDIGAVTVASSDVAVNSYSLQFSSTVAQKVIVNGVYVSMPRDEGLEQRLLVLSYTKAVGGLILNFK